MRFAVQFDTSGVGVGYHWTTEVGSTAPVACRKPCARAAGTRLIKAQDVMVFMSVSERKLQRACFGYPVYRIYVVHLERWHILYRGSSRET